MKPNITENNKKSFVCINCGELLHILYKKYNNTLKPVNCHKCHRVADRYIEFEAIIVLIDNVLLAHGSLRHALYNRDFKLHWKLSLVLLILESFALWRCQCEEQHTIVVHRDLVEEFLGFYICCLQNICDYILHTFLWLLLSTWLKYAGKYTLPQYDKQSDYIFLLLKSLALASFSKFFLLPILVWRQNTTDTGAYMHRILVLFYHLCSLLCVFRAIVQDLSKLKTALLILPLFILKEQIKLYIFSYFSYVYSILQ